jgi:hypothetical protein
MGNTTSAAPTVRRQSSPRVKRAGTPKVSSNITATAPEARPKKKGAARRRSNAKPLPRDPTTGRYLPRGARAASPMRQRRVQVQVFGTPQSDVHADAEIQRAVRGRRASPRKAMESEVNSAPSSPVRKPRAASPRKPKAEAPVARQPKAGSILRSSYTRVEDAAAPPRARSSSPVSRREYASPSLAAEEPKRRPLAPATTRKMRKMATTEVAADAPAEPTSPVERMSFAAPKTSSPSDLLFSYLNAA